MGHLGLTPQSVHRLGYRRQAEDQASQEKIFKQGLQLQHAGCFGLVIEHVPTAVASQLTKSLEIPVIGIGAGKDCDGQVRVTADLLGLSPKQPPFSQPIIQGHNLFVEALQNWVEQQHLEEGNPTKEASE